MDERVEDSLTSSMVDYVFFVLKKCTRRVLSTCNIDTVCAIINLINATLNIDFREVKEPTPVTLILTAPKCCIGVTEHVSRV